jgi:hypothetical protein
MDKTSELVLLELQTSGNSLEAIIAADRNVIRHPRSSSVVREMEMARSTFLLQFQERCDDTPMESSIDGETGGMAVETGTRSRETNDQHASDTALSGETIAQVSRPLRHATSVSATGLCLGAGTSATKSRETTDQNRADDALGTQATTAVREADDTDPSQRSYRTFSW